MMDKGVLSAAQQFGTCSTRLDERLLCSEWKWNRWWWWWGWLAQPPNPGYNSDGVEAVSSSTPSFPFTNPQIQQTYIISTTSGHNIFPSSFIPLTYKHLTRPRPCHLFAKTTTTTSKPIRISCLCKACWRSATIIILLRQKLTFYGRSTFLWGHAESWLHV